MDDRTALTGIALSRRYFFEAALPVLHAHAPHLVKRCAAGLCAGGLDAGCGSEVYGYDDALSRDHNWGPRFFLFLNEEDYASEADKLRALLCAKLPTSFAGYSMVPTTRQATHFHITTPLRNACAALGVSSLPQGDEAWYHIPEAKLAEYAAGVLYHDPLGLVSPPKAHMAAYPTNVLRKRLAGAVFMTYTAGNALRCAARGEGVACAAYLMQAVASVQRAALLLCGKYPPHVKWRTRAMAEQPSMPAGWAQALATLPQATDANTLPERIDAALRPLGELLLASGLLSPTPLFVERPFLRFNCYGLSQALEDGITGPLAGRPQFVALDQMSEGYLPHTTEALEAHWGAGRPGIARKPIIY